MPFFFETDFVLYKKYKCIFFYLFDIVLIEKQPNTITLTKCHLFLLDLIIFFLIDTTKFFFFLNTKKIFLTHCIGAIKI